jgi:hypothetical protein
MRAGNPLRNRELESLRARDLMVLKWICEQCAARRDHVHALIGLSEGTAGKSLTRLCAMGLLSRQRYIVGEPEWLLPTRAGLNAWGEGGGVFTPTLNQIAHFAAVNDVRLHLWRQRPAAEWIPERRLRRERSEAGEGRNKHIPDGILILEGRRVAVEVELHYKGKRATESVLAGHSRAFDAMLYYCDRLPYTQLTRLEKTGRWPKLGVRTLPGADWGEPHGG